jgi:GMP synthase-like glutamine amidotransferase
MILFIQNDVAVPSGLYGTLLAERKVPHRLWRPFAGEAPPELSTLAGVIVLGGYMGVHEEERYPFLAVVKAFMSALLARNVPQLGICLGGQLLASVLGAEVRSATGGEHGCRTVRLTAAGRSDPLFAGLAQDFPVFEWHNDSFAVPPAAAHLAASAACPGQALRAGRAWGVQFHPEVDAGIVEAWRLRSGFGAEASNEFRRRQKDLQAGAVRLLENFLAIAGVTTG